MAGWAVARVAPRAMAKRLVPKRLRSHARRAWEDARDWIAAFFFAGGVALGRRARPRALIFFGYALGDDLLCTTVLRELARRGAGGLVMVTDHPALFAGNSDVAFVQPLWHRYDRYGSAVRISQRIAALFGGRFLRLEYAPLVAARQSRPPSQHIIAEMCARAGITGEVALRPYLFLQETERAEARSARGAIVIQSSGMAARHPMPNKQWPVERLQSVVTALRREVEFIQVGAKSDPALEGAKDRRGTGSLRETAAILAEARLFVGTVGFLMHLARAVECPAVIIFGGREAPWQSGYTCNRNLFSAVPSAPCWHWGWCTCAGRCMDEITVADVVAAIRDMLGRPRGPLAVDRARVRDGA